VYTLILNPTSGRGMGMKTLPEIEAVLQKRGIVYQVKCAQDPEEATLLARQAVSEAAEGVIAMGGDGTLFQIVNGLAGSGVPMLFVSCGTGNDFVKSIHLPKDPVEALKLQLDSSISRIDVGSMNDCRFLNVSGTGFDVDVLRHVEKYKEKYAGLRPYVLALRDAVKHYKPTTAWVSIDDGPEEKTMFSILSIGNGRYIGGGMKAVPYASVNDGLFDVVTVAPVPKWAVLFLIPFYIAGKHITLKLAKLRHCRKITLRCEGMTLNLDGELRASDVARYELQPGALAVRLPQK